MAADDVVLWDAESLFGGAHESESEYITDVFRRDASPPPAAVAIAIGVPIGVNPGDVDDEGGPWIIGAAIVFSKGGVSQGKARVRFEPYLQLKPIRLSEALTMAGLENVSWPTPMSVVLLTRLAGAQLLDARELGRTGGSLAGFSSASPAPPTRPEWREPR